jgi:tRNA(Met) C34 N-acetyltransferase TmcA
MDKDTRDVLAQIVRFEPIHKSEIRLRVPTVRENRVESEIEKLDDRGFVVVDEDERVMLDRDPFNKISEGQVTLDFEDADSEDVPPDANIPEDIRLEGENYGLELTEEQRMRFDKMFSMINSRGGTMNQEQFIDWVLEQANRFVP